MKIKKPFFLFLHMQIAYQQNMLGNINSKEFEHRIKIINKILAMREWANKSKFMKFFRNILQGLWISSTGTRPDF